MQSRRLSVGSAVAGIAVALGLFIVLNGDDGSDSGSTTTDTSTTTTDGPRRRTTTTTPEPTKITFATAPRWAECRRSRSTRGTPSARRHARRPGRGARPRLRAHEGGEGRPDREARLPGDPEGVFEIEVHHLVGGEEESGVQVAELKVTP